MTDPEIKDIAERILREIEPYLVLKRWLNLREAASYSGYGQKKLIELALRGDISGYQDPDMGTGKWIFDRDSIDKYRIGKMAPDRKNVAGVVAFMKRSEKKGLKTTKQV